MSIVWLPGNDAEVNNALIKIIENYKEPFIYLNKFKLLKFCKYYMDIYINHLILIEFDMRTF